MTAPKQKKTESKLKKKPIFTITLLLIFGITALIFSKWTNNVVNIWDTVSIEYTAYFENQTIFESNKSWELLTFKVWDWDVIKWIDDGIIGMKLNKTKTIKISPENGYGEQYNPRKVKKINDIIFQNLNITPKIWKYYDLQGTKWVIVDIKKDWTNKTIFLDTNSRNTRQNLNYEITVKSIQN